MLIENAFFQKRGEENAGSLLVLLIVTCLVTLFILWDRRYRREWQQFRSKAWPKVEGIFVRGEGEIVTMTKGSSSRIAGYEAWLYYEYQCEGEQNGIYRRFFPTKPEAETFLNFLDGKKVPVRVKRRKPSRSNILDRDIELLEAHPDGNSVIE
jgi:hypothetical protein